MEGNPAQRFFEHQDDDPDVGRFFWTGGPVELAERTWFQSQGSGVTAFDTDDGVVLIDAGTLFFGETLAERVRQRTPAPIHTVVYTHGHIDHAFGTGVFLTPGQPRPRVVGHELMAERFERYERTARHNHVINTRQFGGTATDDMDSPEAVDGFGRPEYPPDTVYRDRLELEVGGCTFLLRHCRGETDDHTWVYCPDREVLCTGDLVIWAVPNAGNPQKAQRYPWDWATGLREMAALRPRSLAPGHGGPVVQDPDKVHRILTESAGFLEHLVEQVVLALEDGSPPHTDIVTSLDYPTSDSPWLQTLYDDAEFIARNTIRYYGGWYTGRPSELKPAPRADLAAEVARLAGGSGPLLDRARQLAADGDDRLAGHLLDYALEAAPDDPSVQEAVAELYDRRADAEPGLMGTNLYRSAAAYARAGRPYA
jgi:glyoxylase-like metal-dependent hydrolase (beta-lactamase superfamily II)